MRQVILVLLTALLWVEASAQTSELEVRQAESMGTGVPITWGVGAKLGASLAWFSMPRGATNPVLGVVAGGFVEMNLARRWTVSADLLYSSAGAKYSNSDIRDQASWLILPVLVNFLPFSNFAIKVGLQPSVLMSMQRFGQEQGRQDVTRSYNRFDLSIPFGISYSINRILIDARYNLGLINMVDNQPDASKIYNSVFTLSVGFRFVY